MEGNLPWKWDEDSFFNADETISMDNKRESLQLYSLNNCMRIVTGDTPLQSDSYHCWTIFVEEMFNAEIMIGIASGAADFNVTGKWNENCRLGMDRNSWVLANGGYISHKLKAVVNEDWRFYKRDHVTVYFNHPEGKLSFAINGKHLGVEYVDVPKGESIFPVVGVTRQCTVTLKSAYISTYNLQLRSLLSLSYYNTAKVGRAPKKSARLPINLKLAWLKPARLSKKGVPPGLRNMIRHVCPWFFERNVCRTRVRPRKWMAAQGKAIPFYHYPKLIILADPLAAEVGRYDLNQILKRKRKIKSKTCRSCSLEVSGSPCGHEKTLRFFRKRNLGYLSSSDDEIFLQSKIRKKCGNVNISSDIKRY